MNVAYFPFSDSEVDQGKMTFLPDMGLWKEEGTEELGLTLIMPVHKGGTKFRLCLSSLKGYTKLFDLIIISFNSGTKNYLDEESFHEIMADECVDNFVLVKQPEVLRPTKHLVTILKSETINSLDRMQPVMFLFHDDFLLGANLKNFLDSGCLENLGTVVLGPWHVRFLEWEDTETLVISSNEDPTDPSKFLEETALKPPSTNASGMIAPLASVLDFAQSFQRSKHGARMEWSIIASRHSSTVIGASSPLVSLLNHSNQAGKQLTYFDYQMDEIRFQIFMLRSGRLKSPKLQFLFILRISWALAVLTFLRPLFRLSH